MRQGCAACYASACLPISFAQPPTGSFPPSRQQGIPVVVSGIHFITFNVFHYEFTRKNAKPYSALLCEAAELESYPRGRQRRPPHHANSLTGYLGEGSRLSRRSWYRCRCCEPGGDGTGAGVIRLTRKQQPHQLMLVGLLYELCFEIQVCISPFSYKHPAALNYVACLVRGCIKNCLYAKIIIAMTTKVA